MEPEQDVVVKVVANEPEAEIVCGLLESAGIECSYRETDEIESPLEDFTPAGPHEIVVATADADTAREVLAGITE